MRAAWAAVAAFALTCPLLWFASPDGKNEGTTRGGSAPGGYSSEKSRYGTAPRSVRSP